LFGERYGGERTGVGGFTRNLTDKLLMADHLDFNQFEKHKRRKNSPLRDRHHLVSLKPRWLAGLNNYCASVGRGGKRATVKKATKSAALFALRV
jgi:hypothetical protein